MKNIILLFLLINCTAVFAQSDIATTPTDELYGYYKKGQSFETIQTEIKNYEALLKMAGYTLQNSHIVRQEITPYFGDINTKMEVNRCSNSSSVFNSLFQNYHRPNHSYVFQWRYGNLYTELKR